MKLFILLVSVIFCITYSSAADFVPAEYGECTDDIYQGLQCTIDSVTVEGCRADRNSKACKLKRNVKAVINVDFTPDFGGNNITMMAYAMLPGGIEKAFPDMNENACDFMTCPVVEGTQQTYSFGLKLASSYPLGLFNVRFLMKKAGQPKCCFVTKFRIEK